MSYPHPFVTYLEGLSRRDDKRALASLRRGLSQPLSAEVLRYILPFLPAHASLRDEAMYVLLAGLYATHPLPATEGLGGAMARIQRLTGSDSIELRFIALVDADAEQLPVHLRHAVQLCKAHNIGLNYHTLLRQLLRWNDDARPSQLQLARQFWQPALTDSE